MSASHEFSVPRNADYGRLNKATFAGDDRLDITTADVSRELTLKLKRSSAANYRGLKVVPKDEIRGLMLVIHYRPG